MATSSLLNISTLSLDLKNFRTVPQKKESEAIKAMITIKPDKFYAIMKSIIEDGYLLTENIIVLKDGTTHTVKEGNRRIASLKLIHGYYKPTDFGIPADIITLIENLDTNWKKVNLKVPCAIYDRTESAIADKVVALAHAKGEKAGRDEWNSVAKARHNRDAKGIQEPILDLLEKYLKVGKNLTDLQKERWAGEYYFTVLQEAIRLLMPRLGVANATEFAKKYPKIEQLSGIDDLMRDIGLKTTSFNEIRNIEMDFALNYGFSPIVAPTSVPANLLNLNGNVNPTPNSINQPSISQTNNNNSTTTNNSTPIATPQNTKSSVAKKAVSINDPKHVAALLKAFTPRGNKREKVVTLRDEIRKIDIQKTPIAFCFLLRSLFEISAKAYSSDHSISLIKPGKNGKPDKDKSLVELLREITKHLTKNNTDKPKVKILHGSLTEIDKSTGILSVTSMNNLVHNPAFSVQPSDICTLFGNIYPLLGAMN
jgi:hypothetical protein